ncbi:MAG: hypothetical protein K2F63_03605 [Muribaculaceae bacterium]|nr:hypothetical protein [Muribaculaceae bacterium]
MKVFHAVALSVALANFVALNAATVPTERQDALNLIAAQYRPGTTGFGAVKLTDVDIDDKKRTVTVTFNENAAYLPLSRQDVKDFKAACLSALGEQYKKYKITLKAGEKNMDDLALFAPKKNIGPKEKDAFIVREDAVPALYLIHI